MTLSTVSSNWVDGIVRCPLVNVTLSSGNASSLFVEDPTHAHMRQLLAAASGAGDDAAASWMPFASTTLLYGIVVAQTLLSVVLLAYKFHGLRLLVARAPREGAGCDETPRVVRSRSVTPSTDNRYWMLYFLSNCLGHAITLLVLQVGAVQSSAQTMRVLLLLQRSLLGCNCFALALALNHQRIHRVKEHRRQKQVSPELIRQVTYMNRGCAGLFFVFIVTDFIRSHLVDDFSTVAQYFYWAFVAMLGVLSVPLCVAVLWIVCNEAPIQPSRSAKALVTVGTLVHLAVMLPTTVWNDHIFGMSETDAVPQSDACPYFAGRMSRYDVVVLVNAGSLALLFAFAALEHARNRAIGQTDHYHTVAARLDPNRTNTMQSGAATTHGGGNGYATAPSSSQASELATMLCESEVVEVAIDDATMEAYE